MDEMGIRLVNNRGIAYGVRNRTAKYVTVLQRFLGGVLLGYGAAELRGISVYSARLSIAATSRSPLTRSRARATEGSLGKR